MTSPVQSLYTWYRSIIRTSKYRWVIIFGTLAYLLSPFDLLPDVIPGIGQIDDVALMSLLLVETSQMLLEKVRRNSKTTVDASDRVDDTPITVDVPHAS
ncbi:MAG: YkvA family protein [Cyanobacteria bacterium J06642_2]